MEVLVEARTFDGFGEVCTAEGCESEEHGNTCRDNSKWDVKPDVNIKAAC